MDPQCWANTLLHRVPKHFHHPKENPVPIKPSVPICPPPASGNPWFAFGSVDLPVPYISYVRPFESGFFPVPYCFWGPFMLQQASKLPLLSYGCLLFHCLDLPQFFFIHSSVGGIWVVCPFRLWWIMLLWTFVDEDWLRTCLQFFGGTFLRVELLHHAVKWKSLSCVRLFVTPWTVQSVEFSRPEYWSG